MWNDPKLVADNPVLANVNQSIVVMHRSDGSGTTFGFTDYLSNVSPDWQSRVGKGTSVNWPAGVGASGNAGAAVLIRHNAKKAERSTVSSADRFLRTLSVPTPARYRQCQ